MTTQNTGKQRGKPRGKPFEKGDERINRGGRPPGYAAFRAGFREEKDLDVIKKRLMKIFTNGLAKDADVIMASRLWYEYGFGKAPAAPEELEAAAEGGGGWPLSREETLRIARGEKP